MNHPLLTGWEGVQMDHRTIIVYGLPRSRTSLMMQMLEHGGVGVVTDDTRAADVDNPRGYCEVASTSSG
jgi:hypothetical protein